MRLPNIPNQELRGARRSAIAYGGVLAIGAKLTAWPSRQASSITANISNLYDDMPTPALDASNLRTFGGLVLLQFGATNLLKVSTSYLSRGNGTGISKSINRESPGRLNGDFVKSSLLAAASGANVPLAAAQFANGSTVIALLNSAIAIGSDVMSRVVGSKVSRAISAPVLGR